MLKIILRFVLLFQVYLWGDILLYPSHAHADVKKDVKTPSNCRKSSCYNGATATACWIQLGTEVLDGKKKYKDQSGIEDADPLNNFYNCGLAMREAFKTDNESFLKTYNVFKDRIKQIIADTDETKKKDGLYDYKENLREGMKNLLNSDAFLEYVKTSAPSSPDTVAADKKTDEKQNEKKEKNPNPALTPSNTTSASNIANQGTPAAPQMAAGTIPPAPPLPPKRLIQQGAQPLIGQAGQGNMNPTAIGGQFTGQPGVIPPAPPLPPKNLAQRWSQGLIGQSGQENMNPTTLENQLAGQPGIIPPAPPPPPPKSLTQRWSQGLTGKIGQARALIPSGLVSSTHSPLGALTQIIPGQSHQIPQEMGETVDSNTIPLAPPPPPSGWINNENAQQERGLLPQETGAPFPLFQQMSPQFIPNQRQPIQPLRPVPPHNVPWPSQPQQGEIPQMEGTPQMFSSPPMNTPPQLEGAFLPQQAMSPYHEPLSPTSVGRGTERQRAPHMAPSHSPLTNWNQSPMRSVQSMDRPQQGIQPIGMPPHPFPPHNPSFLPQSENDDMVLEEGGTSPMLPHPEHYANWRQSPMSSPQSMDRPPQERQPRRISTNPFPPHNSSLPPQSGNDDMMQEEGEIPHMIPPQPQHVGMGQPPLSHGQFMDRPQQQMQATRMPPRPHPIHPGTLPLQNPSDEMMPEEEAPHMLPPQPNRVEMGQRPLPQRQFMDRPQQQMQATRMPPRPHPIHPGALPPQNPSDERRREDGRSPQMLPPHLMPSRNIPMTQQNMRPQRHSGPFIRPQEHSTPQKPEFLNRPHQKQERMPNPMPPKFLHEKQNLKEPGNSEVLRESDDIQEMENYKKEPEIPGVIPEDEAMF